MIDGGKQNVVGVLVDAVDYAAATERIIGAARRGAATPLRQAWPGFGGHSSYR